MLRDLVILLGNACNLRCDYCSFHEREPDRQATCRPERVRRAIDLFFAHARQRPGVERVLCLNSDGEALLARPLLLEALQQAARLRGALPVTIALVTNGTLVDRQIARELARLDVAVTVSVDGAADVHEQHRGAGTHRLVLRGIEELHAAGVPLGVRAVVTPQTVDRLAESHAFLWSLRPARPIKLRPVRTARPPALGAQWVTTFTTRHVALVRGLLERGAPLECLPDDALHLARHLSGGGCRTRYCGAGAEMLWMSHSGQLTPCGLLSAPEDAVGHIDDVSAEDLPRLLDHPASRRVRDAVPTRAEPCRSCRFAPACHGGCPVLPALPLMRRSPPPLCELYSALGRALEPFFLPAGREERPG